MKHLLLDATSVCLTKSNRLYRLSAWTCKLSPDVFDYRKINTTNRSSQVGKQDKYVPKYLKYRENFPLTTNDSGRRRFSYGYYKLKKEQIR